MDTINFKTIWDTLSKVDCSGHTEKKKTGSATLTYLSWSWAWGICMKHFPEATYEIREWDGKPWLDDPVAGVMVMTHINIGGNVRAMWLAAMDGANNALKAVPYSYFVKGYDGKPLEKKVKAVDMTDINKAIMRCLVKNLAMFGLGLNIYAGEDLPVGEDDQKADQKPVEKPARNGGGTSHNTAPIAPSPVPARPAASKPAAKPSSPLAKDAWKAFKALGLTNKMTDAQRSESFRNLLKEQTGKIASAEVTDEEWQKVINHISVLQVA